MHKPSPLRLDKRYRTRGGHHVTRLEYDLGRLKPDGFAWRAWFTDLSGTERMHWYNRWGQWSNDHRSQSELDLMEEP